ncbi:type VI secretion system-associated FHA domain protein TagH [Colwellia sp. 20A7]|uniref:type VI secretion system-associated FHA domain protein TagH n=1 Tax=Colwellia sp. 20A7 TaxID=2689569 RepID=UPI0013577AC6|nr:type VI secretion system-associated FHA domain protein TagH [Colwellia sp. 20A7]
MELIFDIVSYHRLSPEQNSTISISNTLTLGRSESNDWHLPDPEKVVSGCHARVEKRTDGFYIHDLSTNGLYINRSVEALGKSNTHRLCDNDLLTFGDYEVSVSLKDTSTPLANTSTPNASMQSSPIPSQATAEINNKAEINSPVQGISPSSLFGEQANAIKSSPNMPAVNNDLHDHFDVPQAIPEEWDNEFINANIVKKPIVEKQPVPTIPVQATISPTIPEPVAPLSAKIVQRISTNDEKQRITTARPLENSSFDAFIKGLGVSESIKPEQLNDKLLYEMGQSMQLMLMGLVESLRARSALKSEFRINQTTFQQQENNPLKFSATIDDVFQNLFLKRSSSFLPSTQAITEAFNDTKKHDIALTAGTLGAIEGIFKQLAPLEIEKKDLKDSIFDQVVPGQKQLRYWKTYQSLHKEMVNEITANGSSVLSDDFVKAYDKKIKSL